MSRRLLAGAALALAPLAVAACSGDDRSAAVRAVEANPAAQPGGALRVGILRPVTLDPQLVPASDTAGQLVVRTMCDPLIGTDPETRELTPALADEWRVLGAAGVQVSLRKGLRFSDGSPVAARDVVASLQRVVDPDVVSPSAGVLQHVGGWQDVQDGQTEPKSLAGIKATSGSTIQMGLDRDDAQFVYALAQTFAIPTPERLSSKPGFSSHPVCVGPYKLAGDYTGVESSITLVRNAGYSGLRPAMSRSGIGWADRVEFRVLSSSRDILAALQKGEIDAGQLGGREVKPAQAAGLTTVSVPTGRLEYVGLPNKGALGQPAVVAALSAALDRQAINTNAFGGARLPAYNLVPPTLPDAVLPEDAESLTCGIPPTGSVERARAILTAFDQVSALRAVGTLPFYFNDEFDNRALVESVVAQWAALGLELTPSPVPFANLVTRGEGSGGFDGVFRMTTTAEFADLADFLLPLVSIDALGKTNYTGYNGELLARQIRNDLMAAVPVDEQRNESLGIVQRACGVPVIPIAWYQTHLGLGSTAVVAAHSAVDRGIGLPEIRELAVG